MRLLIILALAFSSFSAFAAGTNVKNACELCKQIDSLTRNIKSNQKDAIDNAIDFALSVEWSDNDIVRAKEFVSFIKMAVLVIPKDHDLVFADELYKTRLAYDELDVAIGQLSADEQKIVIDSLTLEFKLFNDPQAAEENPAEPSPDDQDSDQNSNTVQGLSALNAIRAAVPKCTLCEKFAKTRAYAIKHGDTDETSNLIFAFLSKAFLSKDKSVRALELQPYLELMATVLPFQSGLSDEFGDLFYDSYIDYKSEFKSAMSKFPIATQKMFRKRLAEAQSVNRNGNG